MEIAKKTGFVKLTRKAVEEMFDICNERYFDNRIEKPLKFETFTPHKKCLGMVRPCYDTKKKRHRSILHISRLYNWTEENLRNTMVHEMIHLAIEDYLRPLTIMQRWFGWIPGVEPKQHDQQFIDMMNELNTQFPELNIMMRAKYMTAYKRW